MSTTFDFPANPTVGQVHVMPAGDQVEWNGYAWTPVGSGGTLTYPIVIAKGGTGATDAATARTNLGIVFPISIAQGGTGQTTAVAGLNALGGLAKAGDTMTGVLKVADGTVAAPSLAFGSEAGLGMYRFGAGVVAWVSNGARALNWSSATADVTAVQVFPRTSTGASQTQFQLYNKSAADTANCNIFYMSMTQTLATISILGQGTTPKVPLQIDALGINLTGGQVTVPSIVLSGTSFGLSADANNYYQGFAANWFWNWDRATGQLAWNRAGGNPATVLTPTGDFFSGRDIYCGTGVDFGLIRSTGTKFLRWTADNWRHEFSANGAMSYISFNGSILSQTTPQGTFVTLNGLGFGPSAGPPVGADWRVVKEGNVVRQYWNNDVNHRFEYDIATGNYNLTVNAGTYVFNNGGTATAPVGWTPASDGRVKDKRRVIKGAVEKVRPLTGYTYHRSDLDIEGIGLIAQDVEAVLPVAVTQQPNGGFPDFRYLNYDAITALLVNVVKELDERLAALELNPL